MKKILSILLSIMTLMLCLVGCNQVKSTVEFSSYMIGSLIGQEEKTEEDKLVERLKSSGALYAYKIDKQETSTTQIVYVWNNLLRRELRLDIRQIYLSVPDEDKSVTIKIYEDSTVKIDNKNIDFEATSDLSFAVLRAIFPKESTVNAKEFRDIFREMAIRLETLEQFGDTEVIAIQTVTSSELLFGNTEDKEVKLVMPVDDTHTEHTYEWVGNEGGHQKVYTCGCEYPDIVELHSDDNGDYKCDVCGWSMAETLPEDAYLLIEAYEEKYPKAGKAKILHYCGTYENGAIVAMLAGSDEGFDDAMWTETVADYDFNYSNGNRIRVLYGGEFYTLTQAYENGYLTKENIADIHIKWDRELPKIEPEAPIEKSYFEIIDELQMSDIVKIETVEYAGSVAPYIREPIEYKTSTLATDIETVYTWLKSLQGTLTQIADEEAQLAGAGTKFFTIYTSQNYFTISDVGRNYLNIEGGFYEQKGETPDIIGETVTYRFESYYDEASLLINDKKAKDYTFDFDKLVCIEKNFETSGNPYKLVASIGVLQLYDEKHFIRNDIQYEIVGKFDFSQIFKDYPTNDSNDSNDIFYAAAYPQDFEYNGRHYRLVQGVGLKTTVTQEELGELLGYIIREEDVSAFTQEYPKVDYVIDNGIYDYDTSNRVAFYSVKAYPDLSLICMNQLGEYVLFQDTTDLLA